MLLGRSHVVRPGLYPEPRGDSLWVVCHHLCSVCLHPRLRTEQADCYSHGELLLSEASFDVMALEKKIYFFSNAIPKKIV